MRIAILLVCILCTMAACADVRVREMGPDFAGVSKHLSSGRPLKILVVHGVGLHEPSYADPWIHRMSDTIGLREQACQAELNPIRHPDPVYSGLRFGSLARCDYRGRRGEPVSLYILTWSPLTAGLKEKYLGYDWTDRQFVSDRSPTNAAIKEHLIDKALSDVMLYLGPFRDQMQYPIQQALCMMMREHAVQDGACTLPESFLGETGFDRFMIVTSSLGGLMVFQTVEALSTHTHALTSPPLRERFARAAEKFAADTSTVFMLGNQLPLLRLGDVGEPSSGGLPPSVETFVTLRYEERRKVKAVVRESLQIVSFSDPNDLLSYPIPESFIDELPLAMRDKLLLTNVMVRVVEPGVMKKFADPLQAHTGYAAHPTVIQLMTCGSRTQATC
ncbi:hypothetical protein [Candidatus Nitrospira bockiana]